MLNIGSSEFFLLGVLFLLLFGPEKLPEIARAFGQAYRAFRLHSQAMTEELRRQLEMETAARSVAKAPVLEQVEEHTEPVIDGDPSPSASKPMGLVLPRNSDGMGPFTAPIFPTHPASTEESPTSAVPAESPAVSTDPPAVQAQSLGDGSVQK
jgi:Sec-independent protein translocase protein TatA